MDILSIGNSFSQDAQRYLYSIARADGTVLNCYNLYIGGCELERHYRNMLGDKKDYMLQVNGVPTGFYVTMKEALLNRNWDVVTIQQASHASTDYAKYQPYLDKLVAFVRECVPNAKLYIHQTWAYENDTPRLNEVMGYSSAKDMLSDIVASYKKAYKDTKADGLIPSGELFGEMLDSGIDKIHRDGFHALLGLGRYALGLLWYCVLTGNDISDNSFCDFDEAVSDEEIKIAKECVNRIRTKRV